MQKKLHTLLVCTKEGHINNYRYTVDQHRNTPFCEKCGSPNIHQCPYCGTDISGREIQTTPASEANLVDEMFSRSIMFPPEYCAGCGQQFPWTR